MVLGVVRYRVRVGQQLRCAAAPVRLIDGCLGARASVARCPCPLFCLSVFFPCALRRDELLPRSDEVCGPCLKPCIGT